MAQYRVLEKSFVNDALREKGEVIEYDPPEGAQVSENLELVEGKPSRAAKPQSED